MADWSELPPELLSEIVTYLNSSIDILRLRSVCSSWRQSTSSPTDFGDHQLPSSLLSQGISLRRRSIYLLSPPNSAISEFPENSNSWVVKIEEKNPNLLSLLFPLSWTQITSLPNNFPRILDLSNIRVREVGREYYLRYINDLIDRGDFLDLIMEKVAFLPGENDGDFLIMTIHVSGFLALFNSVDNQWHIISDNVGLPYDDFIAFNGAFYAVNYIGSTVLINYDTHNEFTPVANPVCGGDHKRLVEIGGELMLVDVYMGLPPPDDDHNLEDLDAYISSSRFVWFKVYRLDWEEKSWVHVNDLGNNILFLGISSAFSASALDFQCRKGNCIYFQFPDNFHPSYLDEDDDDDDDATFKFHSGGVFNLEDDSISFSKLFWPPPPWVASSSLEDS